jgi:hypothetical protein
MGYGEKGMGYGVCVWVRGEGAEVGGFKGCTYAASHRFALKSRWMTWSSMSTWLLRYESIIWPIGVVRSWKGEKTC